MFGEHIGSLSVYKGSVNGTDVERLWTKNASIGRHWQKAMINVESKNDYEVSFDQKIITRDCLLHLTTSRLTSDQIYFIRLLCFPILSYPILSYPILSYPILSYPILSYPVLSYPILSYPIPSHPIPFHSILLLLFFIFHFFLLSPNYIRDVQIVIKGKRGNDALGDIAIDDISIIDKNCSDSVNGELTV